MSENTTNAGKEWSISLDNPCRDCGKPRDEHSDGGMCIPGAAAATSGAPDKGEEQMKADAIKKAVQETPAQISTEMFAYAVASRAYDAGLASRPNDAAPDARLRADENVLLSMMAEALERELASCRKMTIRTDEEHTAFKSVEREIENLKAALAADTGKGEAWNVIESEADLPKEDGMYWLVIRYLGDESLHYKVSGFAQSERNPWALTVSLNAYKSIPIVEAVAWMEIAPYRPAPTADKEDA